MPIVIPPLRDRPDDIPQLALRFAMRAAADMGKQITGIVPRRPRLLQDYPWPGNVRELQHAVERAVILSHEPVLLPRHFEAQQGGSANALAQQANSSGSPHDDAPGAQTVVALSSSVVLHSLNVDDAERVLIKRALEVTHNNRTRAAELLGMSVRTLRNKLNVRHVMTESSTA